MINKHGENDNKHGKLLINMVKLLRNMLKMIKKKHGENYIGMLVWLVGWMDVILIILFTFCARLLSVPCG